MRPNQLNKLRIGKRDLLVFIIGLSAGIVLGLGSTRWRASPVYNLVPHDVVIVRGMSLLPNASAQETYTVNPDGRIDFGPIYGKVPVAGLTIDQAEVAVQDAIEAKDPKADLYLSILSTVEK